MPFFFQTDWIKKKNAIKIFSYCPPCSSSSLFLSLFFLLVTFSFGWLFYSPPVSSHSLSSLISFGIYLPFWEHRGNLSWFVWENSAVWGDTEAQWRGFGKHTPAAMRTLIWVTGIDWISIRSVLNCTYPSPACAYEGSKISPFLDLPRTHTTQLHPPCLLLTWLTAWLFLCVRHRAGLGNNDHNNDIDGCSSASTGKSLERAQQPNKMLFD